VASIQGEGRATAQRGVMFAIAAYSLFATQDAIVKGLVARYEVPEILFARSVLIVGLTLAYCHWNGGITIHKSKHKPALFGRTIYTLLSWLAYYTTARWLPLAEMTTLYFAAPILVVVLSRFVLKESVDSTKWISVALGFSGVLVAVKPSPNMNVIPAAMILFSAVSWAYASILVRRTSAIESSTNQMLAGGITFLVACAALLPFIWVTPSLRDLGLMLLLGLISSVAQYLLYEGYRQAPASTVAPTEYTMFVWAVAYGAIFWGEMPALNVLLGAGLIIGSGLWLLHQMSR
jgi:S-adenosylmethionine uptake transporter